MVTDCMFGSIRLGSSGGYRLYVWFYQVRVVERGTKSDLWWRILFKRVKVSVQVSRSCCLCVHTGSGLCSGF